MYDTIVIGLGAMGSATACHLARRGQSVLGLEQYALGHAQGSSHGQTRIIRQAYFEHPDYVPLLQKAYRLWEDLARETDLEIVNLCGLVMAGPEEGEVIAGTRIAAATHSLPLESVDGASVKARFPHLRPGPDMTVLFDPLGGYLRVEHCVRAHLDLARAAGAELRDRESVLMWRATEGGVEVITNIGTYQARNLAVCAGPWAGEMLEELALPLTTHRVVSAWFQTDESAHSREQGAPVFAMETPEGFFYGFPQLDSRGVKVAGHFPGAELDHPAAIDRTIHPEDVDPIRAFAGRYLNGIRLDDWTANTCIYTMSPDSHFILDRHPAHEQVFLAAGFSGHGFKFSSVIGAILADYCTQGHTDERAGFLRLGRFGTGSV